MQDEPSTQQEQNQPSVAGLGKKLAKKTKARKHADWKPLGHVRDSFAEQIWKDRDVFRH